MVVLAVLVPIVLLQVHLQLTQAAAVVVQTMEQADLAAPAAAEHLVPRQRLEQ
jgi:hypothetical protein